MTQSNPPAWRAPAGMRRGAAMLLAWLLALSALALAPDASAQVIRAYTTRYFNNFNGNVKLLGNMVMTCGNVAPFANTNAGDPTPGVGACPIAQQGGHSGGNVTFNNNNDYTSIWVDADGDPTTQNSSASVLNMPAGSTVLFAGLYWGASAAATAPRGQVLLKTPAGSGYNVVNASQLDATGNNYGAFADVTSLVNAGGPGTYWGANLQGTLGLNQYAGWALVVVYADNTQPLRNVTVFDGYALVNTGTPITLTPSGFLTPYSGPVLAKIGTIAYEGDLGILGDSMAINGTPITDAANPATNYLNSSATDGGVSLSTNTPYFPNMMSFDIDNSSIPSGVIPNGATSATITYTTAAANSDQYYPHVAVFSTNLYVPVITPNLTKTATDLNGTPLLPGDTIRWTMAMNNTGQDTGINLVLTDPIPANTTYKPGTLNIISGANAGVKSDASGDDQAEKTGTLANAAPVVFRLGTGANATQGGQLAFGQGTSLSFDTIVNANVSSGTQISNTASISYNGQTLYTTSFSSSSSAATLSVLGPPTITKSFNAANIANGGTSQLSIVVTNPPANPNTLTGVVVADTYPTGLVNAAVPNPQVVCTPGSTAGGITGGTAGGNTIGMNPGASIAANGSCTITVNVTGPAGTYTNTTSPVTSGNGGTGGTASATLAIGKISIAKSFAPSPVNTNTNSLMTLTLTNNTGATVSGGAFTDTYPSGLVNSSGAVVSNGCGGTPVVSGNAVNPGTVSFSGGGNLADGASCSITINVRSATGGVYNNTTSGVTRTGDAVAGNPSNTASLTVIGAPTVVKSFSPTAVAVNGVSTLSIVITNPNTVTVSTAGTAFTDTYPTNLVNTTPRTVTLNCSTGSAATLVGGAAGGNTLGMSALTLAPGGSCTVTSAVTSGNANTYNNSATVVYDNAPTSTSNTATLTVTANTAPVMTKSFSAASIPLGGTATMTVTVRNPNGGGLTLTGVAFTDNYPTYLFNSSTPNPTATNCGPGVVAATAGGNTLSLSGATINAGVTCTVTVQITSNVAGNIINNSGAATANNAPTATAVTAAIDVAAPPNISKTISPSSVAVNSPALLTINVTNPPSNTVALTGVAFIDTYPTGLVTSTGATVANTCNGTATASAPATNPGTLTLSAGTLAVGATCSVSISVLSATPGTYTNTLGSNPAGPGNITSTQTGPNSGPNGIDSATLTVGKLGITKSFSPATIPSGGTSTVTFQITNGTGAAVTGLAFTDTLTSMQLTNGAVGGTCGGVTSNASAGVTSFAVTAGNVPLAGCTITVTVTSTTTGTLPNTTSGATRTGDAVAGAPSNTANLTVTPPPSVIKSFSPTSVAQYVSGGQTVGVNVSVLTISIFNSTGTPATGGALVDNYPANLVNAAAPSVSNGCGGTVTATAGSSSLTLSGGTFPANSVCSVSVNVLSTVAGSYTNTIPAGAVNSGLGSNSVAASATLQVMQPASVSKSFTPGAVAAGASSQLLLTLTNPNAVAVTGGALVDTYPAGVVNATPPGASTSCPAGTLTATAGGNTLQFSGLTIPASGSCTVSVFVTSATNGTYTNNIAAGALTTSNAGASNAATSAVLAVGRPLISKSFSPNPIAPNGISTLSFVLTNPITSGAMTTAQFTDTFPTTPGAMVVAATPAVTNTCGGVVTAVAGTGAMNLTGGTIPAAGNCTISVNITAPTSGTYNNATSAYSTNTGTLTGNVANASLIVTAGPTVAKDITPAIAGINQPSVLTITLTNPNAAAITGAGFTDNYPGGMVNTSTPGGSTTCTGGSVTAANGGSSLVLSGATIPASGSCTVTVNVTGISALVRTNTLAAGSVTSTNAPANAAAANDNLTTLSAPTVAKAFAPNPVNPGVTSVMTITLTNGNTTNISGGAFVDSYPSGLLNTAAAGAATNCVAGVVNGANGGNSLTLTGATIPASGSCTVTVNVSAASGGAYVNNTGPVSTNNAGTGAAASATLNVNVPAGALAVSKSFPSGNVGVNVNTSMIITITNPNPFAVTGVTFTDSYPANLVNAVASPPASDLCGLVTAFAINSTSFNVNNKTIAANSSCTIQLTVKGTAQNTYNNCVPTFTPTGPAGMPATPQACGTLQVGTATVPPPTISKAFSPSTVGPGAVSTLTFTISNAATSGATVLAFDDVYPSNVNNTNPAVLTNTCGGTLTGPGAVGVPDGNNGIHLAGGSLGAFGGPTATCTITTQVVGASPGAYVNTTGTVSATINAATRTGNTATAALTVSTPATISKAFSPASIASGGTSSITFTLGNPTATLMAGASFTDTLTSMTAVGGVATGTCTNVGSNNVPANATSLSITGLSIAANSSCTVIVPVTSSTPGTLVNASSGVTSGGVTGSPSNTAQLTVTAGAPSISKAFSPATIPSGTTTTMTLTLTNPNAVALTGVSFTDGMTNMALATTPSVGGTCTGVTTTASGGATSFTVTGGTIPASGSCTITVQVTSNLVGTWPNQTSGVSTTQTPTAGSASNTASLTVLASGVPVSGLVYNDLNANGTPDNSENWAAGTSVFVNIISGGAVVQSVAVGAGSGAYGFTNIPVGNYTIVVTNSAINTVAVAPATWSFTSPTDGTIPVAVGTTASLSWNFGLRQGQRISGRVFRDTGVLGSPTLANNGILDTNEANANPQNPSLLALGFGGVTVNLYPNNTCTGAPTATTTTDGGGNYVFSAALATGNVCIQKVNPNTYVATGASVNTTALTAAGVSVGGTTYTYCRPGVTCGTPPDAIIFTANANTNYTNINFGVVPGNTFFADQSQQGPPGTTVNYAHTFVPGSVGSVTFSTSAAPKPAITGWSEVIYRDLSCNAVLDGSDPVISGAISVDPNDTTAGDPSPRRICIIVREFIPPNAPAGAEDKVTISAAFIYTNAAPALPTSTLTVVDTTLTGSATGGDGLRLRKEVCNVTTTVAPGCVPAVTGANAGNGFSDNNTGRSGDELMYRIIYSNASSNNLSTLVVNDATPPYTVRSTLTGPAYSTTPAGLTNGSATGPAAGQSGAFSWTFTGNLAPNAQGVVTFNVQIQ